MIFSQASVGAWILFFRLFFLEMKLLLREKTDIQHIIQQYIFFLIQLLHYVSFKNPKISCTTAVQTIYIFDSDLVWRM